MMTHFFLWNNLKWKNVSKASLTRIRRQWLTLLRAYICLPCVGAPMVQLHPIFFLLSMSLTFKKMGLLCLVSKIKKQVCVLLFRTLFIHLWGGRVEFNQILIFETLDFLVIMGDNVRCVYFLSCSSVYFIIYFCLSCFVSFLFWKAREERKAEECNEFGEVDRN